MAPRGAGGAGEGGTPRRRSPGRSGGHPRGAAMAGTPRGWHGSLAVPTRSPGSGPLSSVRSAPQGGPPCSLSLCERALRVWHRDGPFCGHGGHGHCVRKVTLLHRTRGLSHIAPTKIQREHANVCTKRSMCCMLTGHRRPHRRTARGPARLRTCWHGCRWHSSPGGLAPAPHVTPVCTAPSGGHTGREDESLGAPGSGASVCLPLEGPGGPPGHGSFLGQTPSA